MVILAPFEPPGTLSTISFLAGWLQNAPEPGFVSFALVCARAVPDLFFPIRPVPDFAGFGMTNPAGTRAGFSH